MSFPNILLFTTLSLFFSLPWWSAPNTKPDAESRQKNTWEQLDSLRNIRQSKTLFEKSDAIFQKALKEKKYANALKALNYKFSAREFREENPFQKNFEELDLLVKNAAFPMNQLAASLQATLLESYYQNNRYKIDQRQNTDRERSAQLEFWTKNDFQVAILKLHKLGISNPEQLDEIDSKPYFILFSLKESANQKYLSSSLYHVLFQRALAYFSTANFEHESPEMERLKGDKVLFANIESFGKITLSKTDSLSPFNAELALFQNMFHFLNKEGKKEEQLLAFYNNKRLNRAHSISLLEDKDSLQILAYNAFAKTLKSAAAQNIWNAERAKLYQGFSNSAEWASQAEKVLFRKTALELAENLLAKSDTLYWKNEMQNLKNGILSKRFSANFPEHNFPNSANLLQINYTNKEKIYWQIFEVENWDNEKYYRSKTEALAQIKNSEKIEQGQFDLLGSADYFEHSMEFELPALKAGNYILALSESSEIIDTANLQLTYFNTTNIAVVHRRNSQNSTLEWIIRDAKTGAALKGAELQVYFREYDYKSRKRVYKKGPKLKSNAEGLCAWLPAAKRNSSIYIDVSYGAEKLEKLGSFYAPYPYEEQDRPSINIFTDRSIYRPGQMLYFKAVGIQNKAAERRLKSDWTLTFRLKDANYQEVENIELTSDAYAAFSGSFQIPESGLNGNYRIETPYGTQAIKVEAYQRPKFELELFPLEGFVQIGDSVFVKGIAKSFAGVALQDADIKYSVGLLPAFRPYYRSYFPVAQTREIRSSTLKTDKEGHFEIAFLAEKKGNSNTQNYLVKITATDQSGESQETQRNYHLTNLPFQINANIPNQIFKGDSGKWKIASTNSSGQAVKTSGSIKVYKLQTPENVLLSRKSPKSEFTSMSENVFHKNWPYLAFEDEEKMENWAKADLLFEAKIESDTVLSPGFLKNIAAGAYKVEIKLENNKKAAISDSAYFQVYDLEKKKLPYPMPVFFHLEKLKVNVGENAELWLGTANKNAVFEVLVLHKNGEEKSIHKIGNTLKNISIPIKKEYEGNISIAVYMQQNGRTFTFSQNIEVPYENRKLELKLEHMRSTLRPGNKEEWSIQIKDENGKAVEASLLAAMYDASLDQIYPHAWYFNPLPTFSFSAYAWNTALGAKSKLLFSDVNQYYSVPFPNLRRPEIPDFELFFNSRYRNDIYNMNGVTMSKSAARSSNAVEVKVAEMEEDGASDKVGLAAYAEDVEEAMEEEGKAEEEIQVRSNFAETAFFFPNLESSSAGKASFKFTVTDAITHWRFQALAHSKDLQFGQMTESFEAKKELMMEAQPLVFLRQGDSILFQAKISNLGEKALDVSANLQWLNPYTQEDLSRLFLKEKGEKTISIAAGETQNIAWAVRVPRDFKQPLMYRVKASTAGFSDGEEKLLPVLENNIALTKSLAFQLDEGKEKLLQIEKLMALPDEARITEIQLEINPNPHWYVIQALPYLSANDFLGSDAIFNKLYAQSISAALANRNPEIERLFNKWSGQLKSPLQRKESAAISELNSTPWLRDALNDEKRMKNIAQLFDVNKLEYEKSLSIKRLLEIQSSNGGWPWIKSMPDSRFITQKIVLGFSRLQDKKLLDIEANYQLKNAIAKAVRYLDKAMLEDYERIMLLKGKAKNGNHLSALNIQYLLLRSAIPEIALEEKSKEAHSYFLAQAKTYWNQFSLLLQAQIALVLHRNGENETANLIVEALKQNSIQDAELGTYWKNVRSPYWYNSSIETHVAILEAIFEIENNSPFIAEMQKWLLNEKRTNNWGNSSATADACYAFLLDNTQVWIQENKSEVWLNGNALAPDKIMEDGSGTLIYTWKGSAALQKLKGVLKISNGQNNLIWGAFSVSFESPLEAVEGYGDELSVVKEIFVKSSASAKEKLKSLSEKTPLVGDELWMRLKIEAKRNFDYVELKDLRAAGSSSRNILSGAQWKGGLYYYQQNTDEAMHFFIPSLQKGAYIIEYPLYVSSSGEFSSGPAQIQCAYASEFEGYSSGEILIVGRK